MAQIEGLQVNIQGNADGLKKAVTEASNKLGDISKAAESASRDITSKLNQAADDVASRYGSVAGSVASSLTSLVNPATLATTAIAALGAGLLAYYESLQEKVVDVDAALKTHGQLIKDLRVAYGEAMAGLEQYTKESENSFRNRIAASIAELDRSISQTANTFMTQFGPIIQQVMTEAGSNVETFLDVFVSLPRKFEPFRSAIDELQRSIRAGNPDFVTFKNSVDEIGASAAGTNPALSATAYELANLASKAAASQQAISANSAALQAMGAEARAAAGAISQYNSAINALESWGPKKSRVEEIQAKFRAASSAAKDEADYLRAVNARDAALKELEPGAPKAAGGVKDNSAEKLAREQEMITKRLEMLTIGWGTEEEKLAAHLVRNQDLINQARAKEAIDDETHKILMLSAEEEYQKKMQAIRSAGFNSALTATGEVFSALGRVVQAGSKKNVKLAKMFGIAEAIIATMVAANKAMAVSATGGPAAAFAAWAAVAAKGLSAVAAIRSVNENGGGGGAAAGAGGGDGGAAAAAAGGETGGRAPGGSSVYINLQGQSFGRDQVRDLVKQIADFQKDGGQVVFA
jgi:hypothetical protein